MQELFGPLASAIYETVHGYRAPDGKARGAVALAPRCGMNPGTLSNKTNPDQGHVLGLAESIPLQLVADDYRILYAYAAALQHVAYRLPPHRDASDVELLDAYAKVQERCGLKARAIRDALCDGNVTRTELEEIRAAFDDEVRAGLELLSRLEALAR